MRIGIDISQIVYEGTGVARFTRGLTETICKKGKKHEWVFFFSGLRQKLDPEVQKLIESSGNTLVAKSFSPTMLSFLWNTLHLLPVTVFTGKLDWFITSDWTEPPANAKKATVVHDLTVFRYPETVDGKILSTQKKRLARVARGTDVIFADSDATKKDVEMYLKVSAKKVHTVYPGVTTAPFKRINLQKILKKYKIKKDFILAVGKLEPRKNLGLLIEAFSQLEVNNLELLIVGQDGWGEKQEDHKDVRFLGYVEDEDLTALYHSCLFFVYPSLWEGFGYPVVEAMKEGAAVATSETSSLGEIAKGVGQLFDPSNVTDIKRSLKMLIENEDLRRSLSKKSITKAKEFTWDNYYNKMIKILEKSSLNYLNS